MHPTERALIQAFNTNTQTAQTTSQLVKTIFPDEYASIREQLQSNNQEKQKQAKRTKAKLHRKLLYYLNKLIDKNILKIDEIKERGEKSYKLAISSGEVILKEKNHTITIKQTENPRSWIEKQQEQGIIHQHNNALHKIEAYAINAKHYPGIAHLRADLNHLYAHIADALLITNFDTFLEQNQETLHQGLTQLIADSQDYNLAITLQINLQEHTLTSKNQQFIAQYALHQPKRLYLLFSATRKNLHDQHNQLSDAINYLATNQIKVNLHNASTDKNTHFLGKTGAYCLNKQQTQKLNKQKATIIASNSLAIDCATTNRANQLQQHLQDAAKTLFARATTQRRISHRALTGLTKTGPLNEQLTQNTTYLRLWNYTQEETYLQFIRQAQEELNTFCELQSRIYSSCGVPIDFEIHLSSAFSHYANLSSRQYFKKPVYKREHLQDQQLALREQLLRIYATDRVRIFREGNFSAQELISELIHVADTYELPLITYDFKELQKTISLESFI